MSTTTAELKLTNPLLFRQACYINGRWVEASSSRTIDVDDPATGEIIGAVPNLGATETRQAIDAAAEAFLLWRKRTAKERATILRRWFELMMTNQEDLAYLMTVEQGKPLTESRGEVAYAASFLEWFGEEAKRVYGDTIPGHQTDKRIVDKRTGRGCCLYYSMELSVSNDHAQSWARPGGGLHCRGQTSRANTVLSPRFSGISRAGRRSKRRLQRDHGIAGRDWR